MPRGCGRVPHLPAPPPSKRILDRHRVFGAQDLCGPGPDVGKQGRRPLAQLLPPSEVERGPVLASSFIQSQAALRNCTHPRWNLLGALKLLR